MNHDSYSDSYIRGVLDEVKTIAMVGASPNPVRPSYFVLKYMLEKGYQVIPVNPGQAGKEILGQTVYASLKDIPQPVDMVDIFRNSEAAGPITDDAIAIGAKVVWMQLQVRNDEAAERAEEAGLNVVMNRCPKIEYGRLSGEIGWAGVNSRTLSSKKPRLAAGFQHRKLGTGRKSD
ncbi:CoA-binding protein [Coralliovum pocilloporae]|uniref:CoA-binding protein n=1 Tax=Coralliovum pocilloporae TaxID=3066369 RepID=UPI0033072574